MQKGKSSFFPRGLGWLRKKVPSLSSGYANRMNLSRRILARIRATFSTLMECEPTHIYIGICMCTSRGPGSPNHIESLTPAQGHILNNEHHCRLFWVAFWVSVSVSDGVSRASSWPLFG